MSARRSLCSLGPAQRGTVAIEFAFVGLALMGIVIGVLHIGFALYAQSVLDQATAAIARDFQHNTTRDSTDPNSSGIKTVSICPALHGMLDCNAISVVNYPVSDFYNQVSNVPFSPGGSKSLMLLKLIYTAPIPAWPVLNGLGSGSANPLLITATVPYVNEF